MSEKHVFANGDTITCLEPSRVGFLLTQESLQAGEGSVVGFAYSADLAAQKLFELTGVELTVEEVS